MGREMFVEYRVTPTGLEWLRSGFVDQLEPSTSPSVDRGNQKMQAFDPADERTSAGNHHEPESATEVADLTG